MWQSNSEIKRYKVTSKGIIYDMKSVDMKNGQPEFYEDADYNSTGAYYDRPDTIVSATVGGNSLEGDELDSLIVGSVNMSPENLSFKQNINVSENRPTSGMQKVTFNYSRRT